MTRKQLFGALGTLLVLGSFASVAHAQYTAQIIAMPPFFNNGQARDIGGNILFTTGLTTVGYGFSSPFGQTHALLWTGAGATISLHPGGITYKSSYALGTSGTRHVGYGRLASGESRALLWNGNTGTSVVNLHPVGGNYSVAYAVSGSKQVGEADGHATLWSGTAASAVDLHPAGYSYSVARAISGTKQGGIARDQTKAHAMLWSGSAVSAVNLHPPGFDLSEVLGMYKNMQVGSAYTFAPRTAPRAYLWYGSAASGIDITPPGYAYGLAYDCNGTAFFNYQVGAAVPEGGTSGWRAVLWSGGDPASAVDLHQFLFGLPVTFIESRATGVSSNGEVVGFGVDTDWNTWAIRWF